MSWSNGREILTQNSYCLVYFDANNHPPAKTRTILFLYGRNLTATSNGIEYQFCGESEYVAEMWLI